MTTMTRTRKPARKAAEPVPEIDWAQLLEVALTAPGSLGDTYNRFYEYSFTNQMLLLMQGVTEPVATFKRWQSMGRQVRKGSKAKWIIRPMVLVKRDEDGAPLTDERGREQKRVLFKGVRCIFALSETDGDELPPPIDLPEWSVATLREALDIQQIPYAVTSGNTQGYSVDRTYAINPVASNRAATEFHEIAHIVLGHTTTLGMAEYAHHRGLMEFQAEATAHLVMHALGVNDDETASKQRAYIQHWLRGSDRPSEPYIRAVFNAVQTILKAGRPQAETVEES